MFIKHLKLYLKCVSRTFSSRLNSFTWRTHTCGELNSGHTGKEVIICGWISFQRCNKFIIIRDTYGCTQVIFKEDDNITKKYLESLPLESVIQVKGIVYTRPPKDVNKKLSTGEIEVVASEVRLLNASATKLGITAKDFNKINDVTKLKYRYLSLRSERMQENLKLRSSLLMKMREFLIYEHGFIDVETPTLFKRTPGGAKEFIVPTKFPGQFYSLTQSPQQFKQMLMVGGIDRYFQIARCYRNEGTKLDRQPEFTQVDIELSFTTAKDIQNLVESLLAYSWPLEKYPLKVPFPRITYKDAMRIYGTDKPDLRYELKIQDMTKVITDAGFKMDGADALGDEYGVFAIVLPKGSSILKKSIIRDMCKEAEVQSVKCFPISIKEECWSGPIVKYISEHEQSKMNQLLNLKPGDILFIAAGEKNPSCSFLGRSRRKFAEYLLSIGVDIIRSNEYSFVWVTDFPLFLQDEGTLESAHHPFTAPHPDDTEFIYTNPIQARGQHYDLVLNGQEIAGGSIRIHDAFLQKYILEEILKEKSDDLTHLLEALKSGCPPHGGIALGIDRILAILCNCHSIADVIAFPKSQDGKDLLSGAPSPISNEDMLLYHIQPIMEK